MIKQVMETGQVQPQNTLKRTREAVSRWLVANDDEEGKTRWRETSGFIIRRVFLLCAG